MKYEQDILRILMEVGPNGLTLQSIVKHVYNANNSLFDPITESSVYQAVRSYLAKRAINANSLILKTEDGRYCLNQNAPQYTQQMLQFGEENEEFVEQKQVDEPVLPFFFD